jgi:hypothetical protein
MQLFGIASARDLAGASGRCLLCALLIALWTLPLSVFTTPAAPSLVSVTRHAEAGLAAKRPIVPLAEIGSTRPTKGKLSSPGAVALVGSQLELRLSSRHVLIDGTRRDLADEPRVANLPRAPPPPATRSFIS